jgi:hypothetical protein
VPAEGFGLPKPRPSLGHSLTKAVVETPEPRRLLRQLREGPQNLRLCSPDHRGPSAASPWRPWLKRLSLRTKPLHRLDLPPLPHPRRHPSWAGLSAAREPVDLARRFLGPHFLVPPLPPGAHGGQ